MTISAGSQQRWYFTPQQQDAIEAAGEFAMDALLKQVLRDGPSQTPLNPKRISDGIVTSYELLNEINELMLKGEDVSGKLDALLANVLLWRAGIVMAGT